MQRNFKLETILTVTTGINFTDNFSDVFEMANFVYNTNLIGTINLQGMRKHICGHILNIHPELKEIRLNFSSNEIDSWINLQKEKYGDVLPISRYGEPLKKDNNLIKSKRPTNKS